MNTRTGLLAQLVREELYVVDPAAVAEAIMVRTGAWRTTAEREATVADVAGSPSERLELRGEP